MNKTNKNTNKLNDTNKTIVSKPSNRPQNKPIESTSKQPSIVDKTIPNKSQNATSKQQNPDKTLVKQSFAIGKTIPNQTNLQTNPSKPQNQDKTITSNAQKNIKKNIVDKTIANSSNSKTSIEKTVAINKNLEEEETKTMAFDDETAKYKGKNFLNNSNQLSNQTPILEKTQVIDFFKTPQINIYKPKDPTFHTMVPPPLLSRKSSENSKFGVKIALETNKINETSSKMFNISEILEFSENDDWEIEDVLLGKGSYGNVYKVHDKKTKIVYALKTIELDSRDDDFDVLYEKTLYEVFLMKRTNTLNSPNILKLVDCFKRDNEGSSDEFRSSCNIMIVMELCECSLNDLIEFRKENSFIWSEQELLYYFIVLLETLIDISKLNIFHRDIKPRNILYNLASKAVKFADFGEGKLLTNELTVSLNNNLNLSQDLLSTQKNEEVLNTVRGTPVYMSPEVYQSFKFRKFYCAYHPLSSDIFSLGLTFMVMKRLDTNITRSELPELVNASVFQTETLTNRLIKAMLLEDPKKRLDSVREMLEKELKPLKNQLKLPDEGQILKLYKMKKDESLNPSEVKQKQMLIANMYRKIGNYAAAKEILNVLLQTIEKESKSINMDPLENLFFKFRNLMSLASIEIDEAKTEAAIKTPLKRLEEAHDLLLTKAKDLIDSDTFRHEYGNLLNEFGRGYRKFKQNSKALEFYQKALNMAKELKSNLNISVISYNLGHLYLQMKKYDEALEYLTLSLKLLESLKKQPQQPNTQEISQQALSKELAKSQKLLADVFYNQRVFNKAEEFGKKALALIQEIYGIHHVNSIDYLNFLGLLYLSMGKNEASLINFNKAYEISIDFLGKDSSKTVPIMLNLGVLYNVMGKDEDAEKILSKCEEICITNKMNPELANTYYNLGNLFAKMKNVEKARDYYKKSLEIYENLKIEIEKLAFIHYNLGVMAISLKEIEPAKLHFKASLDKYQTFLGKQEYANHTNVKKMTEFIKKLK